MSKQVIRSEDSPEYTLQAVATTEDAIIAQALEILARRTKSGPVLISPQAVRDYLTVRAAGLDKEVFAVMFLNAQHGVIETETMFTGTLTQTSVYPREVVRRALHFNAAAVILTHNHPSGTTAPSRADEALTSTLKTTLALIDVRVLDHIITAGGASVSMAEMGLV